MVASVKLGMIPNRTGRFDETVGGMGPRDKNFFNAAEVRTFLVNPLAEDPSERVNQVRRLAGIVDERTA
jgi:hypothetical protein